MTSDDFTDASSDLWITKRTTTPTDTQAFV